MREGAEARSASSRRRRADHQRQAFFSVRTTATWTDRTPSGSVAVPRSELTGVRGFGHVTLILADRSMGGGGPGGPSPKKKRQAKRGTTFSYTLDRAAAVRVAIARALSGRVSGKSCVAPTRRNRRAKTCTRYVALTTLTQGGKAQKNSLPWRGRYGKKRKAAPTGAYRASASAVTNGKTSKIRTLTLKIVKP